jgi:hypothetical protein
MVCKFWIDLRGFFIIDFIYIYSRFEVSSLWSFAFCGIPFESFFPGGGSIFIFFLLLFFD